MTPVHMRTIRIAPDRLDGWLSRFGLRHGDAHVEAGTGSVICTCPDGAVAEIPLRWGTLPGAADPLAELVATYLRERTVGALLVRRKAHAVGLFTGSTLVAGRHDHHYVQGTTKAGGWSQQRYARRRHNQAAKSYAEAAADVETILGPVTGRLDALILGGDRAGVRSVLAGFPGLRELAQRTNHPVYPVADPNRTVLAEFPGLFRAVPILLNDLA